MELERINELNTKGLMIPTRHYEDFHEFVKRPMCNEDLLYTVHIFKLEYNLKKEKFEKIPRNLRTVGLSSISFAKNNAWEDNKIILEQYLLNPQRWKDKVLQMENCRLVFAHDCKAFVVLDIDCEEDLHDPCIKRLLLKYPFYLSVRRQLPKILLPLNDKMPPFLQNCSKDKILLNTDVLGTKGNLWSFVPVDGKVFNADFCASDIHCNDYKDFPDLKSMKNKQNCKEQKDKVRETMSSSSISSSSSSSLSSISSSTATSLIGMTTSQFEACLLLLAKDERFNERSNWLNILIIIKRYYNNADGIEYAKMFSKAVDTTGKKYDDDSWTDNGEDLKTWNSIEPFENGLTIGTLRYHAKMVDPETYNCIFLETSSTPTYEERKLVWETTHFKVLNPILYCETIGKRIITRTPKQLTDTFCNLKCVVEDTTRKNKMNEEKFILTWVNDENIRTYSCFDFDPGQSREYINDQGQTVFNLYSGAISYPVLESNEKTDKAFGMFLTILKHLTGNNEECFAFLMKMIAHFITKPHIKSNFILLFLSYEGAGKGLIWNFIGEKLIGDNYYVITSDVDSVFGHFNYNAKEKLLIIIDEAEGKDLYSIMNRIKHQSTEDRICINEKHKPLIQIQNFGNYVFLTNNPRAVKIEETDRRFVCFEASSQHKDLFCGDDYQFLVDQMKTPEFVSKAYHHFIQEDLSQFNPKDKNIRPKTELYNKMKYVPQFLHFLYYFFYQKRSLLSQGTCETQEWPLTEWWDKYKEFCAENNFVHKNTHTFTTDLKKYENIFVEKNRKNYGNFWRIDPVKFKQYCITQKFIFTDYDEDACIHAPTTTFTGETIHQSCVGV